MGLSGILRATLTHLSVASDRLMLSPRVWSVNLPKYVTLINQQWNVKLEMVFFISIYWHTFSKIVMHGSVQYYW